MTEEAPSIAVAPPVTKIEVEIGNAELQYVLHFARPLNPTDYLVVLDTIQAAIPNALVQMRLGKGNGVVRSIALVVENLNHARENMRALTGAFNPTIALSGLGCAHPDKFGFEVHFSIINHHGDVSDEVRDMVLEKMKEVPNVDKVVIENHLFIMRVSGNFDQVKRALQEDITDLVGIAFTLFNGGHGNANHSLIALARTLFD